MNVVVGICALALMAVSIVATFRASGTWSRRLAAAGLFVGWSLAVRLLLELVPSRVTAIVMLSVITICIFAAAIVGARRTR